MSAAAAAAALIAVTAVAPAAPAAAHAAMVLTVNDDGRGSVSVDVAWEDGHPVAETIAATMTATSGGTLVGPVPLTRIPGRSTVVYEGTLPAGDWQVVVDAALPGIAHCEAAVTVGGTAGQPRSTRCGPPPSAAAAQADPPAGGEGPGAGPILLIGLGVLAAAGAVVLVVALVRRRRPAAADPRRTRPVAGRAPTRAPVRPAGRRR